MRDRLPRLGTLAWIFAGLLSLGCVDPAGDYGDFQGRAKQVKDPIGAGCGAVGEGDAAPACDPVAVGDLDGQWLFALSVTLAPKSPILFFADIVTRESGGGIEWQWTLTALDAKTRAPIAPPDWTPLALPPSGVPADGKWSTDLEPIDVPGTANPISFSEINADVVLSGDVCGGRNFLCGALHGVGKTPTLTLDLEGSTWTLEKLTAPDTLPEKIFVNCSCTQAGAPPT
jgi:hypothetical protein